MKQTLMLSILQFLLLVQSLIDGAAGASNRDDGYTDVCQGHALIIASSTETDGAGGSTHDPYLASEYVYDGGFNGGQAANEYPNTPQVAMTQTEYMPYITADFKVGCQEMVYWFQTVYIANTEFNSDNLSGASLYVHMDDASYLPEHLCAMNVRDGGFFDCKMFGSYITLLNRQTGTHQIGFAEMRLYSEANVMQYATLTSSSSTLAGYGAGNLLTQKPRTTSSTRAPNSQPGLESCTIFSSFPAVMTFDLTGTAYVKYILVVGNAAAPTNFNNFSVHVGNSPDYTQNAQCPGGPYVGPDDADYGQANTRLGVEKECMQTGQYVSLVKAAADPGETTFDVCTFGVMASCDCAALTLQWEGQEEYFDRVQVRVGERNVFDLHAPEYTVTDANLAGACEYKEWDCEFWFGIRQPADSRRWLTWVTTINGGRLVVTAPEALPAGDYELHIETFDLHDPASRTLNTHLLTIEVLASNQDLEPTALAPIILEPGRRRYEPWRLLQGVPYSLLGWMELVFVDFAAVDDFIRLDGWYFKVIRSGLRQAPPGEYVIWFQALFLDSVLPDTYFYQVVTVLETEEEEEAEPEPSCGREFRDAPHYQEIDGLRCYCTDARPCCARNRGGGRCFNMDGGTSCAPQGRGHWGDGCPLPPSTEPVGEEEEAVDDSGCLNTNYGAVDIGGDGCDWYRTHQRYCGDYDDRDFIANDVCCHCGGGSSDDSADDEPLDDYEDPPDDGSAAGGEGSAEPETPADDETAGGDAGGADEEAVTPADETDTVEDDTAGCMGGACEQESDQESANDAEEEAVLAPEEEKVQPPKENSSVEEAEEADEGPVPTTITVNPNPNENPFSGLVYNGAEADDFTSTAAFDLGGFEILDKLAQQAGEDESATREEVFDYLAGSGINWSDTEELFDVSVSGVREDGTFDLAFGSPIDPRVAEHFLGDPATAGDVLSVAIARDGEYLPVQWVLGELSGDKITIQLVFDDPSEISNSALYDDELVVQIKEPHVFVSADGRGMLNPLSLYQGDQNKQAIPRQAVGEPADWQLTLVDMSGSTVTATAAAGGTAAGLHAVANTPLGPTLSLAFFVQNMVMLPAANELTPDNVQGGVGGFTEVARLDFLPFGDLGATPAEPEASLRARRLSSDAGQASGLSYLGFRSSSFWTNIGSGARVVVAGYVLLALVFAFVKLLPLICTPLRTSSSYRRHTGRFAGLLFWNGVIHLLMLGANVILTAAFISLSQEGSAGTEAGTSTASVPLAIGACALYAGLVLASACLFRKYRDCLGGAPFERTYGAMSKNLRKKTGGKLALSYIFFFVLRRALLVFILVWGHKAISLYGILVVQLLYCVYLCGARPMYQHENRQEILTEYVFLVLACFSLLFTDYVPSGLTRHSIGYIQIMFIMLFIAYKVLYIVCGTLRGAYVFCKKCQRKMKEPKGGEGELEGSESGLTFPNATRGARGDADEIEDSDKKDSARHTLTRYASLAAASPAKMGRDVGRLLKQQSGHECKDGRMFTVSEDEEEAPTPSRAGKVGAKDIVDADFKKSRTMKRTPRKRTQKADKADDLASRNTDSYSYYAKSAKGELIEVEDCSVDPQDRVTDYTRTPTSINSDKRSLANQTPQQKSLSRAKLLEQAMNSHKHATPSANKSKAFEPYSQNLDIYDLSDVEEEDEATQRRIVKNQAQMYGDYKDVGAYVKSLTKYK